MKGLSNLPASTYYKYNQSVPSNNQSVDVASREFEGLFIESMFKEITKSLKHESDESKIYFEWFTAEVAKQFARNGGLGIAKTVKQSLNSSKDSAKQSASSKLSTHNIITQRVGAQSIVDGAKVSSGFGMRTDPFHGKHRFHNGVDLAAEMGAPVKTPYDGVVKKVATSKGFGKFVVVEHKGGYTSLYGHLSEHKVSEGTKVFKGDVVGLLGQTGRATGPHVHFELKRYGQIVDPEQFVQ